MLNGGNHKPNRHGKDTGNSLTKEHQRIWLAKPEWTESLWINLSEVVLIRQRGLMLGVTEVSAKPLQYGVCTKATAENLVQMSKVVEIGPCWMCRRFFTVPSEWRELKRENWAQRTAVKVEGQFTHCTSLEQSWCEAKAMESSRLTVFWFGRDRVSTYGSSKQLGRKWLADTNCKGSEIPVSDFRFGLLFYTRGCSVIPHSHE